MTEIDGFFYNKDTQLGTHSSLNFKTSQFDCCLENNTKCISTIPQTHYHGIKDGNEKQNFVIAISLPSQ